MKEWISLERLKSLGMDKLFIFLLAGVLLLVIWIPADTGRNKVQEEETGQTLTETGSLEQRLKETLEQVQGVGQVQVMITMTTDTNAIEGVVVVAEGAGTPRVEEDIIETAQALFPIAAHKIKVCRMTE